MSPGHAAPPRVVQVQGGLGNQLFCVAFAHSLACLTGERVGLEVGGYRGDRYGHVFELAPLAADLGLVIAAPGLAATRLGAALGRALGGDRVVGDRTLPRGPTVTEAIARRGRLFVGYWQNEAWIVEPPAFIAAARRFVADRAPGAPAGALAVHYRSYAEERRADRRRAPAEAYFRAAYAKVLAAGSTPADILLVSDQPDLAIDAIGGAFTPTRVQKADKYADLATLMTARSLILTNSSFSWWGGYLSDATIIAYPGPRGLFHYASPAARFQVVDPPM